MPSEVVKDHIILGAGNVFDWDIGAIWKYSGANPFEGDPAGTAGIAYFMQVSGGADPDYCTLNIQELNPGEVIIGDTGGQIDVLNVTSALAGKLSSTGAGLIRTIGFSFSGGGSEIPANSKSLFRLPWGFSAESWTILASANAEDSTAANCAATVNLYVDNWSTSAFPTTDVVGMGTNPAISAAIGATGTTDWGDEAWASGQVVMAKVASGATAKWLTLIIQGTQT